MYFFMPTKLWFLQSLFSLVLGFWEICNMRIGAKSKMNFASVMPGHLADERSLVGSVCGVIG
jgi:hypothetical protein